MKKPWLRHAMKETLPLLLRISEPPSISPAIAAAGSPLPPWSIAGRVRLPVVVLVLLGCLAACDRQVDPIGPTEATAEAPATPPDARQTAAMLGADESPEHSSRSVPATPAALRLEDAVWTALQRNGDLRIERLRGAEAIAFVAIERGRYDLILAANAEVGRQRSSETARSTGERFDVEAGDQAVGVGLQKAFATGTELGLRLEQERNDSDRTPRQVETSVGLSLTQALLRGFGPAVNLAAVRQAEIGVQASRFELQGYLSRLVATVEATYWRLALAEVVLAAARADEELAVAEGAATQSVVELGAAATSELLAAERRQAEAQQELSRRREDVEQLRRQMARLLDLPPSQSDAITLATSLPPVWQDDAVVEQRLALALQQRPDLAEARLRLQQRRLATRVTRNGLLPRLDFFIDLDKTGFAERSGAAIEDLDGSSYDLRAGLSFEWSLSGRLERGRHQQAVAGQQQAELAVAHLEVQVAHDLHQALARLARRQDRLAAAETLLAIRRREAEQVLLRQAQGLTTDIDGQRAAARVTIAQAAVAQAQVDLRLAELELYEAEGSLLDRRGIIASQRL